MTVTVWLLTLEPFELLAVRVTVNVPAESYVCVGLCAVLVPPSPKVHDHDSGVPVEVSVNWIEVFAAGEEGENEKAATGADAGDDNEDDGVSAPPQAQTKARLRMSAFVSFI
jgi:hypothetical protein